VTPDARGDPAPFAGDRRLAERLVANLFDNAVGHNVAGGYVRAAVPDGPCYRSPTADPTFPSRTSNDSSSRRIVVLRPVVKGSAYSSQTRSSAPRLRQPGRPMRAGTRGLQTPLGSGPGAGPTERDPPARVERQLPRLQRRRSRGGADVDGWHQRRRPREIHRDRHDADPRRGGEATSPREVRAIVLDQWQLWVQQPSPLRPTVRGFRVSGPKQAPKRSKPGPLSPTPARQKPLI